MPRPLLALDMLSWMMVMPPCAPSPLGNIDLFTIIFFSVSPYLPTRTEKGREVLGSCETIKKILGKLSAWPTGQKDIRLDYSTPVIVTLYSMLSLFQT